VNCWRGCARPPSRSGDAEWRADVVRDARPACQLYPAGQVSVRGQEVKLTPKEFDLLYYLVSHADCIATHAQLLMAVWGKDLVDDRPLLRVHIANLRQKIEPQPSRPTYVLNEPGVGYRFRHIVGGVWVRPYARLRRSEICRCPLRALKATRRPRSLCSC